MSGGFFPLLSLLQFSFWFVKRHMLFLFTTQLWGNGHDYLFWKPCTMEIMLVFLSTRCFPYTLEMVLKNTLNCNYLECSGRIYKCGPVQEAYLFRLNIQLSTNPSLVAAFSAILQGGLFLPTLGWISLGHQKWYTLLPIHGFRSFFLDSYQLQLILPGFALILA